MSDHLRAACKFLGWQGGTVRQARAALERRETALIREYNRLDDEGRAAEAAESVRRKLAEVQVLLMGLVVNENPRKVTHERQT